jgi:hypothetical protein
MQGGIRVKTEFGTVPEDNSTILQGFQVVSEKTIR